MALTSDALHTMTQGADVDAWRVIVKHAVEIASKPLAAGNAPSEVVKRDREQKRNLRQAWDHLCGFSSAKVRKYAVSAFKVAAS